MTYELFADQTPTVYPVSGPFKVHFIVVKTGGFGPSTTAKGTSLEVEMTAVRVEYGQGYDSIKELIENTIQKDSRIRTTQELAKLVASDCRRGFGKEYPELGVVAYAGSSPYDKPIAMYKLESGKEKFIAHPFIEDYIKKI